MTTTTRRRASAAATLGLCLWLACGPAAAVELPLPSGAQVTRSETEEGGAYRLPTGAWTGAALPAARIDGTITRTAWRIAGRDLTPLQILEPLRGALEEAGWEVLFDCETGGCGGFDFRFATEVLPAPAMYVDLTDYRFLAARGPGGAAGIGLLVSRDGPDAYVQAIRAVPGESGAAASSETPDRPDDGDGAATAAESPGTGAEPEADAPAEADGEAVIARLEARGHAVLADLRFESGATSLGAGAVASLDAIAAYLAANPDRRVLIVGHTDATGSLEANRAVSRARARAAAGYLREAGVPAARINAEGAGYLAPVASNLTAAGRLRNRRVEAVLLPAE